MDGATSRRIVVFGGASLLAAFAWPARAEPKIATDLASRLTAEQLRAYRAYLAARATFDQQFEMYWALIEERKDNRRRKRAANQAMAASDYVAEQPPKYTGPPLPPDVQKVIESLQTPGTEPDKPMATVADFLAAARAQFAFAPTITTERDFKRRYAIEALSLGLNKLQVVRVYALETGGDGTFDMQAGFHPVTRQGRAISSALGYAQLLGANSTSELVKHGDGFIQRLDAAAAGPGVTSQQSAAWQAKAQVLRRMLTAARSVPNEWSQHRRFAQTPQGLAIHAINLDADVGPWLQALKLRGIVDTAAKEAGRTSLTGGQLEIMNLAGPRNGLEMMDPIGSQMPTANFFEQGGYLRNSIVRERTGGELLRALDERMDGNIKRAGAIEFLAVFDEAMAGRPAVAERAGLRGSTPEQPVASAFDTNQR